MLSEGVKKGRSNRANEVTSMAMMTIIGKETYEFGDLTKKLAAGVFGGGKKNKRIQIHALGSG